MKKTMCLGVALALCVTSALAENAPLRIGIEAAYPPFAFKTADGNIGGFDYDIGNALCAQMQTKCVWVEQEFDGLIPSLKVRKIDAVISSMLITDERKRSVTFTDKYYSSPARLVMKAGSQVDDDFSQLKGKRIGVQRGTSQDRYATDKLQPLGTEIVRYGSQSEIYLDMQSARLDGTIANAAPLQEGFLKTPQGEGFAFVGPELRNKEYFGEGTGIAVSKGNTELAQRFNSAIKALRADGVYQQVEKKYFDYNIYGE
ncbi:Lysine/arginine/ornithine-binding periplasmic protein [Pseudomonas fluorescens]|jgi:arginine/ornithine transport system substrate-binding protein|uniref:Lysine/arginine/ornithine-binding periplasmic protein n=1 Tax=Pseudomonas fluorescens TaxID=294 RepID=A0A5E7BIZ1_PSEFL|nr:ABC transporter substrate-binding protein [Pseudomonas fluorescens]VVN92128.1 Lysine/arginine/ornithine-binding periplasmic protein [Pseudomonas fluorescens]VVO48270.1 Lysine/arginine/ornithine-binding periplasmic protein [Pseudomonas fluorescens]